MKRTIDSDATPICLYRGELGHQIPCDLPADISLTQNPISLGIRQKA